MFNIALSSLKKILKKEEKKTPLAFASNNPDFEIIALGTRSGVIDGNLTAYLIRPLHLNEAVLCDAGTLGNGLKRAEEHGALDEIPIMPDSPLSRAGHVLKQTIRAYLISHAHLDHVAGLVLSSPDDTPKPIYTLPSTRELISKHLFNNKIWGNQGNRGSKPALKKYTYNDMSPNEEENIPNTSLHITAWPLNHGNTTSTAFLIRHTTQAILYLGDTEYGYSQEEDHLKTLWKNIAPYIHSKSLKAIIIEVTFNNNRPENNLSGHMTPKHLLKALHDLAQACGGRHHIRGLKIIVTHVKETFIMDENPTQTIYKELNDENDLGVQFIMAEQSARYLV